MTRLFGLFVKSSDRVLFLTRRNWRQHGELGLGHGHRVEIGRLCGASCGRRERLGLDFVARRRLGRRGRGRTSRSRQHRRYACDLILTTQVVEIVRESARTLIRIFKKQIRKLK